MEGRGGSAFEVRGRPFQGGGLPLEGRGSAS